MIRFTILWWFLFLVMSVRAPADVLTFRTVPDDPRNTVLFRSNAPLEKIVGKTHALAGFLKLDPESPSAGAAGRFEVELDRLDTGLPLRNQHMRELHLETDRYPVAVFRLKELEISEGGLLPGTVAPLNALGEFSVHGVARDYRVSGTLVYKPEVAGGQLICTARWTVRLADHEIHRPHYLFMKLAEEQEVVVECVLEAGGGEVEAQK